MWLMEIKVETQKAYLPFTTLKKILFTLKLFFNGGIGPLGLVEVRLIFARLH